MYLGIDLGTSGLKLLLLDEHHHVHATADAALDVQRPHPHWSEQHPQDWWQALEQAVAELRAKAPAAWAKVRGIGLSGQMHGAVLLNKDSEVLRPAILWNDGRSASQCIALETAEPASRQITGNLAMPGFTAPKLLWVREHEPDLFDRVDKVLLPKDWLRLKMTGESVSDMSDASGTLWLDVSKRRWSEAMLKACGLTLSQMPRLIEGSSQSAYLTRDLATRWGLRGQVFVAGGAGDNAASAVGIGATRAGEGFISLGTSGVAFMVTDTYQSAPELAVHAFAHAVPNRWHQMAVMLSAASAFGWITRLTGSASEAALATHVESLSLQQQATAPIFVPYLNGERTPHNNALASGSFVGLRSEHGATDLAYAVMEGVAFGLADGLAAMNHLKPTTQPLALVGGGARNNAWAQLLASTLGRPMFRPQGAHAAAALGAARLAWLADGATQELVCQALPTEVAFEPNTEQAHMLAKRYDRFKALYPALLMHF